MATTPAEILNTPRHDAAPVPVPTSCGEAVAIARGLADRIRPGAHLRDVAGDLPHAEVEWIRESGLLTLPVPQRDGGPGASHATIAQVFAILAAADSATLQVVQPHFSFVDNAARYGTDEQRALLLGEVLRGARFGNALSERGGKHAFDFTTRLVSRGDGTWTLNGTKYYATGAYEADWIAVVALDDKGRLVTAFVPAAAAGVDVDQDWNTFGQRATLSGTATFIDVQVRPEWVIEYHVEDDGIPTTLGAYPQLLHAAIDVGIARGALDDGVAFTKDRARPWPGAGVDRAVDDPHVQELFGRLQSLVEAAELYLDHAADLLDAEREERTAESVAAARLGVGKAKAFAGEVVLEVTTAIFDGSGSSAADERHGLDRHWRNARAHTLHDPNRWKYIHAGRNVLLGEVPPASDHSI
ncbi:MAG: acyl-CoA dehydrogenase family protein [Miltoncostaeaceae bacterium]